MVVVDEAAGLPSAYFPATWGAPTSGPPGSRGPGRHPVITTATDVQGLPALDLLAAEEGLVIENLAAVKDVSMALLSGQPVGLVDRKAI